MLREAKNAIVSISNCPKCSNYVVKSLNKTRSSISEYVCTNDNCDFQISNYFLSMKLSVGEIKKILKGDFIDISKNKISVHSKNDSMMPSKLGLDKKNYEYRVFTDFEVKNLLNNNSSLPLLIHGKTIIAECPYCDGYVYLDNPNSYHCSCTNVLCGFKVERFICFKPRFENHKGSSACKLSNEAITRLINKKTINWIAPMHQIKEKVLEEDIMICVDNKDSDGFVVGEVSLDFNSTPPVLQYSVNGFKINMK